MPLLPLTPLSAVSAGYWVALAVALGALVALAVALEDVVLPPVFCLPAAFSSPVALVASSEEVFRRVMTVPRFSSERPGSMPAATSSGTTSCTRLQSHRADFGHALSLETETPMSSATSSSFL